MGNPIKAISSIFSPPKVKVEKPAPVIAAPPPEVVAAAARKRLQARAQKGREGTIYSQAYGGTNLGGTS